MPPDVESGELLGIVLVSRGVVSLEYCRPDGETMLRFCGADVLEHGLVAGEWLSGPVLRDLAEEPVLDGVPFGGSRGIVGDGDLKAEGIAELFLEGALPCGDAVSVATAAVGEDEDAVGMGVAVGALALPPQSEGVARELGCVVGGADEYVTAVGRDVVDTVGDGPRRGRRSGSRDRLRGWQPWPTWPPGSWNSPIISRFLLSTLMTGSRFCVPARTPLSRSSGSGVVI